MGVRLFVAARPCARRTVAMRPPATLCKAPYSSEVVGGALRPRGLPWPSVKCLVAVVRPLMVSCETLYSREVTGGALDRKASDGCGRPRMRHRGLVPTFMSCRSADGTKFLAHVDRYDMIF